MKRFKADVSCLTVLGALWAVFHHRILFEGHTEVLLDASRFFYPLWEWGESARRQGFLPLWNPDAAFGTPYLADPRMAAWYPPLLLAYSLFSSTTAFSLLTVGHHLWALLGFWLFARQRGFSPVVALTGCLIFGFSLHAVTLAWVTSMLFAFSWIPWVFLAWDGLKRGREGFFLALVTGLALQTAAGYPLLSYLTGFVLILDGALGFFLGPSLPRTHGWRRVIGKGALAAGLALAYNFAWLLPAWEMIPMSNLGRRLTMVQDVEWGDLASWLNPFSNGHPLFFHPGTPFSCMDYFAGLPLLVLILWGAARKKIDRISFILFSLILVLSLGGRAFVGGWLKHFLPGYALLVRSGYWISLVNFMAVVLFMEATRALFLGPPETPRAGGWKGAWIAAVTGIYGAAFALGVPLDLATFWISLLLLLAAGMDFRLTARPSNRVLLVAASVLFSLGPAVRSVHFTLEKSYYGEPETLKKYSRPGRLFHSPRMVDSFQTLSGGSVRAVYEKQKRAYIPNLPLAWGREEVCFTNTIFLEPFLRWYLLAGYGNPLTSQKAMGYLNVRYLVARGQSGGVEEAPSVTENLDPSPKWFSARKSLAVGDWPRFVERMGGPSFDFKTICAVSTGEGERRFHPRRVKETLRTPNRVDLEAKGPGEALLVSSEIAYPGWSARVGDEWRPVEMVNHDFRGLTLADGEEKASFVYRPLAFRLGCFGSLLACGLWAALVLRFARGKQYA